MAKKPIKAEPGSYEAAGIELGQLLDEKQIQYGDSFSQSGDFLKLLYPNGVEPKDYTHMLCLVRIFDKMARIASPSRSLDTESPFKDLAGYGMLGDKEWDRERKLNDADTTNS